MARGPERVAAVVRHREAVLGCREPGGGAELAFPTAPVDGSDPAAALGTLLDALRLDAPAVERRGGLVEPSTGATWPFLVGVEARSVGPGTACPAPIWDVPGELARQDDDRWWRLYTAVAPTVETVASDSERGSTAIATDALWALRDAATTATTHGRGLEPVRSTASALLDARPSMAALSNRVNRAMAAADTPEAVEQAATDGIKRASVADDAAARLAAETVGGRVLTLSRSGTVRTALLAAEPSVLVLASLPGGEGVLVADALAEAGLTADACADAEVYDRLRAGHVDAVLVGADAVTPDGGVVNKVGTRAAALAAERAGVPFYAVCASDKIQPASGVDEVGPPLIEPGFDWTPPDRVTAVLTERGRLSVDEVAAIAAEHAELATWQEGASSA